MLEQGPVIAPPSRTMERECDGLWRRFIRMPADLMSDARAPAVLDLIGNTPLVEVTRFDVGPCTLLLKLESQNPGGSIKDRIGRSMIEGAELRGALKPGGAVVEATAGNTGLG